MELYEGILTTRALRRYTDEHPTGRFGQARRRPVEAVTHWNRFDDKRR